MSDCPNCDALRADVARLERQVNASVAVGNYKALVLKLGDVNADLRACAEALEQMTARYVSLVNSGDCGNWNPEEEVEVLNARAALGRQSVQEILK